MTLSKASQLALASGMSLLAAGFLAACGTLTVDFVYVTSSKAAGPNQYGEVDVYEVNAQSGRMRNIPSSPFPSGGRNPVAEVPSPDNTNLYIVNHDDNSIVQFVIGSDGKLYPQKTVNTPGVFPISVAVAGKFLAVADTFEPLPTCSSANPCSGSVAIFPIGAGNALGAAVSNTSISASYWPLTLPSNPAHIIAPTAIATASSGAYVYVTAYDASVSPTLGYIFGFAVNSDGTLTALNSGVPFAAGVFPSAIASGGSNVYVTDYKSNTVLAYSINSGLLTPVSGSPFKAGNGPSAVVADKNGKYVFVTDAVDSNLIVFASSGGALSSLGSYVTGNQPVAIGVDPSLNEYLYTANFLGNSVTGFQVNASTGALLNSQYSPYAANANPTAVAAIPHGSVSK